MSLLYDSDDDDEIKQKFENTFNRSIINDLKCWNQLLLFTVAPKPYGCICCHRDTSVTPLMVQMDGFTRLPPSSTAYFVCSPTAHTNGKLAVSICCSRFTLHFIQLSLHFTT